MVFHNTKYMVSWVIIYAYKNKCKKNKVYITPELVCLVLFYVNFKEFHYNQIDYWINIFIIIFYYKNIQNHS